MHRRTAIGVITGASLAALTGGSTDGTDAESPAATEGRSDPGQSDPDAASAPTDARPGTDVRFELAPVSVTECGTACREATTSLVNTGSGDATGVDVSVTVTADETVVWETDERIGRLAAGTSVTRTYRIEIDLGTGLAIRGTDGQVVVAVTIESDQRTERIVREKDVAI